jgi:hypothetical protein
MDGFFVAKIQKLSDKRPGEEAPENPEEEKEKASEKAATEVSDDESPKQRGGAKAKETAKNKWKAKNLKGKNDTKRSLQGSQGKGPKDRKRSKSSSQGKEPPSKKAKVAKISVPPTKLKQKSKPLSAKVSKPRRKKSAQDNM